MARIDPGVVSLVAETARPRARQTAEELEQWKTHHEDRKAIDTSPAAITLALLLTDEEWDSLCEMLWVCSRVRELHSAATVTLEISSRNSDRKSVV